MRRAIRRHGEVRSLGTGQRWAWAPDAMKRSGKYSFYVTADDQIGVGVSEKPYGPFKDPLGKPLVARGESGTRVMDPAISTTRPTARSSGSG